MKHSILAEFPLHVNRLARFAGPKLRVGAVLCGAIATEAGGDLCGLRKRYEISSLQGLCSLADRFHKVSTPVPLNPGRSHF
ncbi:MAG: hypothetical protein RR928_08045 [Comamonas sp.]|uniref:hypothetical protein n=1 Tax=Comamonas sp. TaxID=34028 RepID=UPI002FC8DF8C